VTSVAAQWLDLLEAAGGSVALSFLVALVLGISALTLLFLGSAVVVLERFARSVRRPRTVLLCSVVWSLAVAGLLLAGLRPEVEAEPFRLQLRDFGVAFAGALLAIAVGEGGVALLLRQAPRRVLARISAVALGAGYALLVGGVGAFGYAVAPAGVAVALAAFFAWRRHRSGGPRGEAEVLSRLFAGVLILGALLALLLPEPRPEISTGGLALLSAFAAAVLLGLLPLAAAGFLDMRGSVEWFVATRYLFAKRRQTFISVITLICVAGTASSAPGATRSSATAPTSRSTPRAGPSATTGTCSGWSTGWRAWSAPLPTWTARAWCAGIAGRCWRSGCGGSIRRAS
jgi:hypothetical protein